MCHDTHCKHGVAGDALREEAIAEALLGYRAFIVGERQQKIGFLCRPHGLTPIQCDPIPPLSILVYTSGRQLVEKGL